jgi:hypothetical protein
MPFSNHSCPVHAEVSISGYVLAPCRPTSVRRQSLSAVDRPFWERRMQLHMTRDRHVLLFVHRAFLILHRWITVKPHTKRVYWQMKRSPSQGPGDLPVEHLDR